MPCAFVDWNKKHPTVNKPGQPWHPESFSYTPSNHLWFLVLTFLSAFFGCVVQSFLRCHDLFVMFDCSSYCLRGLTPSQRLRHNCCFALRGFDTPCLTDIQSVGTVLSLTLALSLSLHYVSSFCWNPDSAANEGISFSLRLPGLADLSPNG